MPVSNFSGLRLGREQVGMDFVLTEVGMIIEAECVGIGHYMLRIIGPYEG